METKSLFQYLEQKNSICVLIEKSSSFSNRFYDKFPVDELRLYHVEIDDIQLVHIWVGLN